MLSSTELSHLWRRHAAALLMIARGHCGLHSDAAEDCVQESFIRLASQKNIPNEPAAWLTRTVRNAAIDAVRSQGRRSRREQVAALERNSWFADAGTNELDGPSPAEIQAALERLDDVTRDIVVSRMWNDLTFQQIANALEISKATAHRKYEAGIENLRVALTAASLPEEQTTGSLP